ncbi:MAG: hypothetical protein WDZ94_02735 [Patescibacteria group bacterium]
MKLPAIQTTEAGYSLLALDQLLPLASQLHLDVSQAEDVVQLNAVISVLMQGYSSSMSGVVLSPQLGYEALLKKAEETGPIFCLERRFDQPDPLSVPILLSQWGVESVRNNYSLAKLELFYHPQEAEARTKLMMLAELYDYCQHEGIDLLVELLVYIEGTEAEYVKTFPEVQLAAIRDIRKYCSLLALEYPLDALGAVTVTAELDVPWILTSRETAYDSFKEQLRIALEGGARGFLGLEQFLPVLEKDATFEMSLVEKFITGTGRDRVLEMQRIVAEGCTEGEKV